MTNTNDKITWERIAQVCPELEQMRKEASAIDGSHPHFCANDVWFEQFKPRLLRLVGFEALPSHPDWMYGHVAYEIAYRAIYDALPDCQACICM